MLETSLAKSLTTRRALGISTLNAVLASLHGDSGFGEYNDSHGADDKDSAIKHTAMKPGTSSTTRRSWGRVIGAGFGFCDEVYCLDTDIHNSSTEMFREPGFRVSCVVFLILVVCYGLIYAPMEYAGVAYTDCYIRCPAYTAVSCTSSLDYATRCRSLGCSHCIDWEGLHCYDGVFACDVYTALEDTSLFVLCLLVAWSLFVVYIGFRLLCFVCRA